MLQTSGLQLYLKKRLWHRCFHVNFAKFLRTPFLQDTSGRLFLNQEQGSLNIPLFIERRKMEMDFKARIHCEIFVSEHFMK